jgi:hypothetical protein
LRKKKAGAILNVLFMGRPEFPSTPINASIQPDAAPVAQNGYQQPTLEGMELEQSPEIELGNCIVTTAVKFRKLVRGNEWHCSIQAVPDLLHLEQEGMFEAHAYQGYADMAKEARLRPGDRAVLRGTMQVQTIALENGEITSINHLYVTAIEVIFRSTRTRSRRMKKKREHKHTRFPTPCILKQSTPTKTTKNSAAACHRVRCEHMPISPRQTTLQESPEGLWMLHGDCLHLSQTET